VSIPQREHSGALLGVAMIWSVIVMSGTPVKRAMPI
jgi:hypothetical protein